jgi:hypothetical protein
MPTETWSGCGPAVPSETWSSEPTEIWSLQLRSGRAHRDLELAVEVWQCPLRSGVRS